MWDALPVNSELKLRIATRASVGIEIGTIYSPRPWFPSRAERADLVARQLPTWAIASAHTAGWVWTGMGSPEPWSVLRPTTPEISPLERTQWRARKVRGARHEVVALGSLRLLDPTSTVRDILLGAGEVDSCASQIAVLTSLPLQSFLDPALSGRSSLAQREHAARVVERVHSLRNCYPDITRYTS